MIQLVQYVRVQLHGLVGLIGYTCMVVGVLMLLFSVIGGRLQGEKIVRAVIVMAAGALLMNFVETYL